MCESLASAFVWLVRVGPFHSDSKTNKLMTARATAAIDAVSPGAVYDLCAHIALKGTKESIQAGGILVTNDRGIH